MYYKSVDIFALFKSLDHLNNFPDYLNKLHPTMEKLPLLDMKVSCEGNKLVSTVYPKPILGDLYTQSDNFLSSTCKFYMIYTRTLAFRYTFTHTLDFRKLYNQHCFRKPKKSRKVRHLKVRPGEHTGFLINFLES